MTLLTTLALMLAQTRTDTGKTNQTSWFPLVIALIVLAFIVAAVLVRRSRRAHGEPPAGSVPASEVRRQP
jgi:LPXTG-motif cell wall-anchored protein